MVLVIGQNSAWQKTYRFGDFMPGSVNRVDSVFASAAGKGANVARGLTLLGHPAHLIAYTGGATGSYFEQDCRADGISADFVKIPADTRVCTTLIEGNGRITELVEAAPPVLEPERRRFVDCFERRLPNSGFLVIAGTAIGGEDENRYLQFVQAAHEAGIEVLLDSYRLHGERALQAGPEILKINEAELADLTGMRVEGIRDRSAACRSIAERYGVRWVIITMGSRGAYGFDGRTSVEVDAPKVDVVNAIGSGDAFSAGVVAAIMDAGGTSAACSIADALVYGSAMGTANCLSIKPGLLKAADVEQARRRVNAVERRV